jgi:hypothetical protein
VERVEVGIVGDVDRPYPNIEIYVDEELTFEILTKTDYSVRALTGHSKQSIQLTTVVAMLEALLPVWREALTERDFARERHSGSGDLG